MYKILSTGEMMTSCREKTGASQNQIKGKVSRAYVSQVEHDKTIACEETIEHIYNNIRVFAKKDHIDLPFTLKDIMQTDEEKINKVCEAIISDIKICKMKKNTKESLDLLVSNINAFVSKYRVSDLQQCEIYSNIAELYINEHSECEIKVYFIKSLELSIKINYYEYALNLIHSLTKMLRTLNKDEQICCLGNYTLMVYEKSLEKDNDIFKRIFFNTAKASKRIGNMQECMNYIKIIENKFILNESQLYELKILKGSCYIELCNYTQAENTFLNILSEAMNIEDSNKASLTYLNLADIKFKTNNKIKSKEYLIKANEFKADERYKSLIEFETSNLYIKLDELDIVKSNYDEVVKLLVKEKEENNLEIYLNNLVEYFIAKNEANALNIITNMVYNYIVKNEIKNKNITEVLFKIVNYILPINIEMAKNISNICVKSMEIFKQNVN